MVRIGSLRIQGEGKYPRNRTELKRFLKSFSEELGMDLQFVWRKKKSYSWCHPFTRRARVCEGTDAEGFFRMGELMTFAFHEMVHQIQYDEGLFKGFYDRRRGSSRLRWAFRAERHCDRTARRLCLELFGPRAYTEARWGADSIYDAPHLAKEALRNYYGY
jgi:hypothetical protein